MSTGRAAGGSLWVQYKGTQNYDSGYDRLANRYQDKVYIHLLRKTSNPHYGQGTELWAKIGQGESYADSYSGKTVYVCAIDSPTSTSTGSARVAIGTSLTDAQNRCGPTPSSPPPAPPASPPPPCVPCTFTLTTKQWGSELSWDVDGTVTSTGSYGNNQDYTQSECMNPGAHVLNMKDSYGDGWNSGSMALTCGTTSVFTGATLASGASGTFDFTISSGSTSDPAPTAAPAATPTPAPTPAPTPMPTPAPTPAPTP
eukprot:7391832-Prymnesium_polylepis.4